MKRIASFGAAGIHFDPEAPLAPAAQLAARLTLAIDAGRVPDGAMLPSIRTGSLELGVHLNTLRKVYAMLERSGYAETRHGAGTTAHAQGESTGVLALAADTARRARSAGVDPAALAVALLAGIGDGDAPTRPPTAPRPARPRAQPTVLPERALARGATIGLVSGDSRLVLRAEAQCAAAGARLLVADPGDGLALSNLAWGCPLILLGPDAAADPATLRALRGARSVEPL
jgi:DNA-binding transcriptional regulator YhcF (GntR family)